MAMCRAGGFLPSALSCFSYSHFITPARIHFEALKKTDRDIPSVGFLFLLRILY